VGADKVFQIQRKYQFVVIFIGRKTPAGQEVKRLRISSLLYNTSQWHLVKSIKDRRHDGNH
jgi:hypothetical protein